jgi:hypothetical protein
MEEERVMALKWWFYFSCCLRDTYCTGTMSKTSPFIWVVRQCGGSRMLNAHPRYDLFRPVPGLTRSRIRIKEFNYFLPKKLILS